MAQNIIVGRLVTGIGQGRRFTQLDWARHQFVERLGIDPYPGTINLALSEPAALAAWANVQATPGIRIDNPGNGPFDCDARCYLVKIEGRIDGAIVLPEVPGYAPNSVEVIAPVGVRDALGISDGDAVTLELRSLPEP